MMRLSLLNYAKIAGVSVAVCYATFLMASAMVPFMDPKYNITASDIAQVLATCYVAFAVYIWSKDQIPAGPKKRKKVMA
jgi:hypothetical protein